MKIGQAKHTFLVEAQDKHRDCRARKAASLELKPKQIEYELTGSDCIQSDTDPLLGLLLQERL